MAWRLLDLDADMVIPLKFPAYFISHHCKVVWLAHQFRQIYELQGTELSTFANTPPDNALRQKLVEMDNRCLGESRAIYTISRRLISGHSPVWGDRKHLHHRLLDAGWSKQETAYFYWFSTAILGVLALSLNSLGKFYTIGILFLAVGGLLLWLKYFSNLFNRLGRDSH